MQERFMLQTYVLCKRAIQMIQHFDRWLHIPNVFLGLRSCIGLAWDSEGDILSMITSNSSQVSFDALLCNFWALAAQSLGNDTTNGSHLGHALGCAYARKELCRYRTTRPINLFLLVENISSISCSIITWKFSNLQSSNDKVFNTLNINTFMFMIDWSSSINIHISYFNHQTNSNSRKTLEANYLRCLVQR